MRDRITELRRVKASALRPNPRNWRIHPAAQRQALRGILAEIGYADALLARPLADGSLELIDGHLRAETTPDVEVPVLVLDVTAEEADKLLAVLDPLAGMAESNRERLASLASSVETDSVALQSLIERLDREARREQETFDEEDDERWTIAPAWQIVIECRDEAQQEELYERLTAEGLKCRVLSM